jgi:hypothetical protein
MEIKKIYLLIIAIIFFVACVVYSIYDVKKSKRDLKNSEVVVATVTDVGGGGGAFTIHVDYKYNGEIIHNDFGRYDIDSLKKDVKVKLLVSKDFPDKYIKYIGVSK